MRDDKREDYVVLNTGEIALNYNSLKELSSIQ